MITSPALPNMRLRVVAGAASTLLTLGGLVAAGAVFVLAAIVVVGSVAGSLFVWSKTTQRVRERASLY